MESISVASRFPFSVRVNFDLCNEYFFDDDVLNYEEYSCASGIILSSFEDYLDPDITVDAILYEYAYFSEGKEPNSDLWDMATHMQDINKNGNTKDKYIDAKREAGFVFYRYETEETV